MSNRSVILKKRPSGEPVTTDFEVITNEIPEPAEGEVLVRNIYMSVDPYMRGRMRDAKSYAAPFKLDEVMTGAAVGVVVLSKTGELHEGDIVTSNYGWREYFTAGAAGLKKIEPKGLPLQSFVGIMGMPGLTAYTGLLEIGKPKAGETVFVSAGSGAVGSAVCQVAKIKGCKVVASAGSDEKVRWLLDVAGVDEAINYKTTTNIGRTVRKKCPDGIDIYFDNVGGDHLQAALSCMNTYGRIVACGSISQYNATRPVPGPSNLGVIVGNRITMRGFIVTDFDHLSDDRDTDYRKWIAEGRLKWKETIVDGLEKAPEAFIGLFTGSNFGKMVVKIGDEPATDE